MITINYKKAKRKVFKIVDRYNKALIKIGMINDSESNQKIIKIRSIIRNGECLNEMLPLIDNKAKNDQITFVNQINSAINMLSDEYRIIIIQSYFNGIPNDLLANKMTIGVATLLRKKREAIELFAYGIENLIE